jgi:Asp-tRNA(Asn)/Glu-tRNA(Gln) amidotransferase A subunit family amidase
MRSIVVAIAVVTAGIVAAAPSSKIGKRVLARAAGVIGLEFTGDEREMMAQGMEDLRKDYQKIREIPLDNGVPPAILFNSVPPGHAVEIRTHAPKRSDVTLPPVPADLEELAFLPVTHLSEMIRQRKVTSTQLTKMYLERLKRLGPKLECVVTLTEDLALEQAARADREIASGRHRGPLHGIPWGAKDLLSVKGYPTTWGAAPYKDQVIDRDATVVERLEEAGAVLVAKLTLGALAYGDVWFGGKTRNPWNLEQGSSGSSAGPAAATAAGLVGFSIGSETWGSIVSPSTRCGTTGLRPTFGRVSRQGAMALSWSMDKLGPICRTVEDCALVLDAIRGPDGQDLTVTGLPFVWNADLDIGGLRVGYAKALFEAPIDEDEEDEDAVERRKEWRKFDLAALEALRGLGVDLIPVELPDLPVESLALILTAEAAAAFDDLTRSGKDDLLVGQDEYAWPNLFRQARFIPAVEYIQANRIRTLAMEQMAEMMEAVDLYVAPSYGGNNLLLTNLTGHPAVVLPSGFREDGTPVSITFTGRLYGEAEVLAIARAYQEATGFHLEHPAL